MKEAWAIRLAADDASALASLRLVPGVEVCVTETVVWARGGRADEAIRTTLRGLPAVARYAWIEEDLLLEDGRRIPTESLPLGPWVPITSWLKVRLPSTRLPGILPAPVPLSLKRSPVEVSATLLLASFADWHAYASVASEFRLARLTFALSDQDQVLIRGTPLPPLSGPRWAEIEGVGVPVGFCWEPEVSAQSLARVLEAGPHQLALWHSDGQLEHIHSEQFIPALRSNVRASGRSRSLAP